MSIVRYLSHPEVRIEPHIPVPEWGLNDVGARRVAASADSAVLRATTAVISSGERKALETAEPIARALGLTVTVSLAMHENDRSSTGFLNPAEFEEVADLFFARPSESIRGWERALDAQRRIVAEMEASLRNAPPGDVLYVGHGGVGTLLYCHLAQERIDRRLDQAAGGGNVFSFTRESRRIESHWTPMEEVFR